MMIPIRILAVIGIFLAPAMLQAQSVAGTWQSIDDQSGQPKAIVKVYVRQGRLYGYIQEILVEGQENALCIACNGTLAGKPIVGMQIINGLEKDDEFTWKGGGSSLFDPEQGKTFRSRIWIHPDNPDILNVRGYWMLFYRTQRWKRVNAPM